MPKVTCCVCGNEAEVKESRYIKNALDVTTYKGVHYKVLTGGIMCKECAEKCEAHQKELKDTYAVVQQALKDKANVDLPIEEIEKYRQE